MVVGPLAAAVRAPADGAGREPAQPGRPARRPVDGGAGVDGPAGPVHVTLGSSALPAGHRRPGARGAGPHGPQRRGRCGAAAGVVAAVQRPNGFCCWPKGLCCCPNGLWPNGDVAAARAVLVVGASSLVLPSVTSTVRSRAAALHGQRDLVAGGVGADPGDEVGEVLDPRVADLGDDVARLQPGRRGGRARPAPRRSWRRRRPAPAACSAGRPARRGPAWSRCRCPGSPGRRGGPGRSGS